MTRTWPDDWEARMAGAGCPMCAEGRPDETEHGVRFGSGDCSDAYLSKAGPARGYAVVVWRGRHVAEPTELSDAEAAAYWRELLGWARLIERHFSPCKLNYQLLGNGVPHLHTHVIPRYLDDPAPGGPLPPSSWLGGEDRPVPEAQLRPDVAALRALV